MKKLIISSLFLFSLTCGLIACTEGLPSDDWGEPTAPVTPETLSLQGSFESKFVRYVKGQKH